MTDGPEFGFGLLPEFKPKPKTEKSKNKDNIAEVDVAASKLGFSSREALPERRKKKGVTKPTDQFNLRAHIEDINTFVEYAEKTNKSYREVFADLVEKIQTTSKPPST
jgi:hypothetical protein